MLSDMPSMSGLWPALLPALPGLADLPDLRLLPLPWPAVDLRASASPRLDFAATMNLRLMICRQGRQAQHCASLGQHP